MKQLKIVSTVNTWAVYLNDLRVISEINEHPLLFIHYLRKRLELNIDGRFKTGDELDYYMAYLKMGLTFTNNELGDAKTIMLHGYTEDLDDYYSYLDGKHSVVKKPKMELLRYFDLLLSKLEFKKPKLFTFISNYLLELSSDARQQLSDDIQQCDEDFIRDRKLKKFISYIEDFKIAIVFSHLPDKSVIDQYSSNLSNLVLKKEVINQVLILYWEFPFFDKSNNILIYHNQKLLGKI